jgi:type III secretion protein J
MRRALLAIALVVELAGCQAAIESGLDEAQANRVIVALDEHGIHGAKEPDARSGRERTYSVLVATDDVAPALAALRAEQLPAEPDPGIADVFAEPSLVPTETEERARLTAALGGELARSIESLEGVLDARVHLALPERAVIQLDEERARPRASVLIRHRGAPPPEDAVRRLIAGGVQDLDPDDVAIVAVPAAEAAESAPRLASIGPIAVARGSAPALRLVLGAMLATNVVLALLLALVVTRRRRAAGAETRTNANAGGGST